MTKSLLLSLLLLALPQAQASPARVFGAAMPAGEAQPIAEAVAGEVVADAGARKFSGRITEVCQNKGCWVMLEDAGQVARVMMKDHSFTVPKDARGAARVYGILSVKELDQKTAAHLASDAGRKDAGRSETVPTREYRIEALSVELLDPVEG